MLREPITILLLLSLNALIQIFSLECGMTPIEYEPLTLEHLSQINSPEPNGYWRLDYVNPFWDDPQTEMHLYLDFNMKSEALSGYTRLDDGPSHDFEFPSPQPFLDIVDYIKDNPEVFFNHSEFNDRRSVNVFPISGDKWFKLSLNNYSVRGHSRYYCIVKVSESPPVPEIEHVFEMIETTFVEELLKHPEN